MPDCRRHRIRRPAHRRVIAYGATFIGWSGGNASESTCHVNRFRAEDSVASQLFQSQWAPRYIPSLYAHLGIYAAFVVLMLCILALLVHRNKVRDRAAAAASVEVTHLHAFEDLTDGQNPDFRCERVFQKGIVLMIQTRCERKEGKKAPDTRPVAKPFVSSCQFGREFDMSGFSNTVFPLTSTL
jgi:hypothetical protein